MVGRMMNNAIARFDTAEKADEIEKYFNDNPIETARRAVSQGFFNLKFFFSHYFLSARDCTTEGKVA